MTLSQGLVDASSSAGAGADAAGGIAVSFTCYRRRFTTAVTSVTAVTGVARITCVTGVARVRAVSGIAGISRIAAVHARVTTHIRAGSATVISSGTLGLG